MVVRRSFCSHPLNLQGRSSSAFNAAWDSRTISNHYGFHGRYRRCATTSRSCCATHDVTPSVAAPANCAAHSAGRRVTWFVADGIAACALARLGVLRGSLRTSGCRGVTIGRCSSSGGLLLPPDRSVESVRSFRFAGTSLGLEPRSLFCGNFCHPLPRSSCVRAGVCVPPLSDDCPPRSPPWRSFAWRSLDRSVSRRVGNFCQFGLSPPLRDSGAICARRASLIVRPGR